MSCLLEYRKIKTKNIKKNVEGKFTTYYKLLEIDLCRKIECQSAYSFDSRISYKYTVNKKNIDFAINNK